MISNAQTSQSETARSVLVTGATGYVGGRLVPRLLERGFHVRCLGRSRRKLESRPWAAHPNVQLYEGDLDDTTRTAEVLRGCEAMYFLVHSMLVAGDDYAAADRRLARRAAEAATKADCPRIIYLGGLGETGDDLSAHLQSRREVEQCLREGDAAVTVLRAAMIIGSGSASFAILRYLVERLPVMVTPRWVRTEVQPIAVHNVLGYLVDCLDVPETAGQTLDIGGPEVVTYRQMIDTMSDALGLWRRLILPVPVLTPRLSSLWIHLVTPLSSHIARPLAEGLRNRVVCRDDRAQQLMPQQLLNVREAVCTAIERAQAGDIQSAWSDAGVMPGDPDWAGGKTFDDTRRITINADASNVFRAVCLLGGDHGYYASNWLWRIRGMMDHVIGGPGLRRGRRDRENVAYGDAIDFWRVTDIVENQRLELRAEMRLPGVATLTFLIKPDDDDPQSCTLTQQARFQPAGLIGLLYWYMVVPLHGLAFNGMLKGIRKQAESLQCEVDPAGAAAADSQQGAGLGDSAAPDAGRTGGDRLESSRFVR